MATASGNEYEIARAFRIQQNQIKLSALGVREASGAIKPTAAPAKPRFASQLASWQHALVTVAPCARWNFTAPNQ